MPFNSQTNNVFNNSLEQGIHEYLQSEECKRDREKNASLAKEIFPKHCGKEQIKSLIGSFNNLLGNKKNTNASAIDDIIDNVDEEIEEVEEVEEANKEEIDEKEEDSTIASTDTIIKDYWCQKFIPKDDNFAVNVAKMKEMVKDKPLLSLSDDYLQVLASHIVKQELSTDDVMKQCASFLQLKM